METIEENKKTKFLSRAGATVKKIAFVFQSDFAVAAGFAVLLFCFVSAWSICDDYLRKTYEIKNLIVEFKNLSFSAVAALLASAASIFFFRNKSKKIIHIFAAIFGAVAFGITRLLIFDSKEIPNDVWGFFLLLLMLFMFAVYSGKKKDESLLFVFSKFINSMIIAHIIFLGLFLCEYVLFECILTYTSNIEDVYLVVSYAFSTCIAGAFYFFSSLNTDSEKNPPLAKMEKGWYHYCLAPIFTVYIALLYVYLLKIIFTWTLPNGMINIFVSIATAAYLFMYFSQRQFDDKFTKIFYKIGRFVMMPLVVVQVISICTRVAAYGFTASRVCSIGYVLVFIVFLVLTFFAKEHVGKIFLVGAAAILILVIKPINISKRISISSQTKAMETALIKNGILSEDKTELHRLDDVSKISIDDAKKISSCYDYLKKKDALPSYCVRNFSDTFGFSYVNSWDKDVSECYDYCYWDRKSKEIDISGYNWILQDSCQFYSDETKKKTRDDVTIYIKTPKGKNVTYDLTDFILSNMPLNKDEYELEISDDLKLVITSLSFWYNATTKRFRYNMGIRYYVLEK